jgi:transcription termination/antitermination protein NusG
MSSFTTRRVPAFVRECFGEGVPGQWHVLHVRSRQEKILAADIAAMGIRHFLPLTRRSRVYGRRNVVIEVPLFPGYLFLRGTLDDAYRCDRTRRVAGIIPVADQRTLENELLNLHRALEGGAVLDPVQYLPDGTRVIVRGGPFRGLEGVIDHHGKRDRLILQVGMLSGAASLELGGALVEPLDEDVSAEAGAAGAA